MKISIITVCYNSALTIEESINSVAKQTYKNIEYIVIDSNSKDNTLDIINKHEDFIDKWVAEQDKGIYDALNKGIRMASGDIIGFLHSDDFFSSSTIIEEISNQFKNKDIDAVYGDLEYVSSYDTTKTMRYWKSNVYYPKLLKQGWMPPHPTLFLKKEVYIKHGLFDLDYRIAADYDFMLRILKDSSLKFTYLPVVITKMRLGGTSNAFGNLVLKMKEDWKALQKNKIPLRARALFLKNFSKIKQFAK